MHRTPSGDRRQVLQKEAQELARDARALQKVARAPAAHQEAQRLQGEADAALAEAEALKLQARLEDLTVWEMEKVKQSRKSSMTYSYWMASWREGGKTRNVRQKIESSCRCSLQLEYLNKHLLLIFVALQL